MRHQREALRGFYLKGTGTRLKKKGKKKRWIDERDSRSPNGGWKKRKREGGGNEGGGK